jgi:hypothetical protein
MKTNELINELAVAIANCLGYSNRAYSFANCIKPIIEKWAAEKMTVTLPTREEALAKMLELQERNTNLQEDRLDFIDWFLSRAKPAVTLPTFAQCVDYYREKLQTPNPVTIGRSLPMSLASEQTIMWILSHAKQADKLPEPTQETPDDGSTLQRLIACQENLDKCIAERNSLVNTAEQLTADLSCCEGGCEVWKERALKAEAKLNESCDSSQEVVKLRDRIERQKRHNADLQRVISDRNATIDKLKREYDPQDIDTTGYERAAEWRDKAKALEAENERLKKALVSQQTRLGEYSRKIDGLEKRIDEYELIDAVMADECRKKAKILQAENELLKMHVAELSNSIDAEACDAASKKIELLKKHNERLIAEYRKAATELWFKNRPRLCEECLRNNDPHKALDKAYDKHVLQMSSVCKGEIEGERKP